MSNNKEKVTKIKSIVEHPVFYTEDGKWYLLLDNIGIAIGRDVDEVISAAYNMVMKYGSEK